MNMTHSQWSTTVQSKVASSWNLHELLPEPLDFFIMLSSLSGIYGNASQSNYAAGCTFQDALARYCVSQGRKAVSLDIGWMRNIGVIAENQTYQKQRKRAADMGQIDDSEFMAVLDIYCNPQLPLPFMPKSQVLIGVVTPADLIAQGHDPPPPMQLPLFSPFSHAAGGEHRKDAKDTSPGILFRRAVSQEERATVVTAALVSKLSRSLSISPDEVELTKPLSDYGVDSLMAVELRNWITKDFQANVAVFDFMSGMPIEAIGTLVVEKSELSVTGKGEEKGVDGG